MQGLRTFLLHAHYAYLTLLERSSGTTVTQLQTIELICDLAIGDYQFTLRDKLMNAGLHIHLETLQHFIMVQKRYSAHRA